jgi:N-acetylglutamate synthase-like GNAT family acetyltransferase
MAVRPFLSFVNESYAPPNFFERISMENRCIRQAQMEDQQAIVACVRAAYSKYLVRMDREPTPLHADYGALIAQEVVYVLANEASIRGVLVLIAQPDSLFVENVAIDPRFQG